MKLHISIAGLTIFVGFVFGDAQVITVNAPDFKAKSGSIKVYAPGQYMGYIQAGDSVTYEVDVPTAGIYSTEYEVASCVAVINAACTVQGQDFDIPATGGCNFFAQQAGGDVTLAAGKNDVVFSITKASWNIKTLKFTFKQAVAGGAHGDPIAYFNGVEKKFLLPIGKLTTLLRTSQVVVQANAFPGEDGDEQWIDRVTVATVNGVKLLDVEVRKDLVDFRRSAESSNKFESITVKTPWHHESQPPLLQEAERPRWGGFQMISPTLSHHDGVSMDFLRMENDSSEDSEVPKREGVLLTCDTVAMFVSSSSALEYYYEDTDSNRALKFAHLDLHFEQVQGNQSSLGGILPELWNLIPKSNSTAEYEAPPETSSGMTSSTKSSDAEARRHSMNHIILSNLMGHVTSV